MITSHTLTENDCMGLFTSTRDCPLNRCFRRAVKDDVRIRVYANWVEFGDSYVELPFPPDLQAESDRMNEGEFNPGFTFTLDIPDEFLRENLEKPTLSQIKELTTQAQSDINNLKIICGRNGINLPYYDTYEKDIQVAAFVRIAAILAEGE